MAPVRQAGPRVQLPGLRLLFAHPQPPQEELNAYYAPDGGWQASRTEKSPPRRSPTKGAAPAMMAALDPYFPASRPAAGSRVFDFGCGTAPGSIRSRTTGGKRSASNRPVTRPSCGISDCSRFLGPEFDLVLAYHVLEHLPRPLDTMKTLARSIRPGGHLLISVPRLDTLGVHRQLDYCLHPRHHIVGFTGACLRG